MFDDQSPMVLPRQQNFANQGVSSSANSSPSTSQQAYVQNFDFLGQVNPSDLMTADYNNINQQNLADQGGLNFVDPPLSYSMQPQQTYAQNFGDFDQVIAPHQLMKSNDHNTDVANENGSSSGNSSPHMTMPQQQVYSQGFGPSANGVSPNVMDNTNTNGMAGMHGNGYQQQPIMSQGMFMPFNMSSLQGVSPYSQAPSPPHPVVTQHGQPGLVPQNQFARSPFAGQQFPGQQFQGQQFPGQQFRGQQFQSQQFQGRAYQQLMHAFPMQYQHNQYGQPMNPTQKVQGFQYQQTPQLNGASFGFPAVHGMSGANLPTPTSSNKRKASPGPPPAEVKKQKRAPAKAPAKPRARKQAPAKSVQAPNQPSRTLISPATLSDFTSPQAPNTSAGGPYRGNPYNDPNRASRAKNWIKVPSTAQNTAPGRQAAPIPSALTPNQRPGVIYLPSPSVQSNSPGLVDVRRDSVLTSSPVNASAASTSAAKPPTSSGELIDLTDEAPPESSMAPTFSVGADSSNGGNTMGNVLEAGAATSQPETNWDNIVKELRNYPTENIVELQLPDFYENARRLLTAFNEGADAASTEPAAMASCNDASIALPDNGSAQTVAADTEPAQMPISDVVVETQQVNDSEQAGAASTEPVENEVNGDDTDSFLSRAANDDETMDWYVAEMARAATAPTVPADILTSNDLVEGQAATVSTEPAAMATWDDFASGQQDDNSEQVDAAAPEPTLMPASDDLVNGQQDDESAEADAAVTEPAAMPTCDDPASGQQDDESAEADAAAAEPAGYQDTIDWSALFNEHAAGSVDVENWY